jgi:hypothetical protein
MSLRILSQKHFPGRGKGPYDDCAICAVYWALAQVLPWLTPPGIDVFRAAAGVPDTDTGSEGLDENAMFRGLKGIWPEVAAISTKMTGWSWRQFLDEAKGKGRPAALIVISAKLPRNYGFDGIHAIGGLHNVAASWWAANPLEDAHNWPDEIEQPVLRSAVEAYRGGVYGVLLPTAAEALRLHPLYQPPGYSQEQIDLALATGRIKGRDELTAELAEGRWAITASGSVTLLRP